jgi:hypothetical protein
VLRYMRLTSVYAYLRHESEPGGKRRLFNNDRSSRSLLVRMDTNSQHRPGIIYRPPFFLMRNPASDQLSELDLDVPLQEGV